MKVLKAVTLFAAATVLSAALHAQESPSSQPLQSDALQKIKNNYENCVFEKGKLILMHSNFRDAIDFAPLACRKQLLQSKKYLLDSAFKVDVIDELVSSIEEGVRIDLVNKLIEEMKQG